MVDEPSEYFDDTALDIAMALLDAGAAINAGDEEGVRPCTSQPNNATVPFHFFLTAERTDTGVAGLLHAERIETLPMSTAIRQSIWPGRHLPFRRPMSCGGSSNSWSDERGRLSRSPSRTDRSAMI